ncbi:MAG: pyrroline-5-carboxylate reductase [Candidatus Bipolaricaulota bacterium]|nr:MAG: pyrroline-5-carboxylate reductase [Candidatus Bipolaricaulota bacterium]
MAANERIAIIGGGNLGTAIAEGLLASGELPADRLTVTRRTVDRLTDLATRGVVTSGDNVAAVRDAAVVLVCVRPGQLDDVLEEVAPEVRANEHVLVSTVSGVTTAQIAAHLPDGVAIVRAMPTIAVSVRESMTCLAPAAAASSEAQATVARLVTPLGSIMIVREEQITPATALCACGVAFFLRAIRAASQGGVQVGFHADEAIRLAAQTARGAASLLLGSEVVHPENMIDNVTTPRGVTIAGLNEMEHSGFSSAMIRGIVIAAEKAGVLYTAAD